MREGYYVIRYAGMNNNDYGMGMLVLDTGTVSGADIGGNVIDGTYQHNQRTGMIDIDVVWRAMKTTQLVQGHTVPAGFSMPIKVSLPNTLWEPIMTPVQTPMGPVNLVMTKVRDFPA